MGNISKKIQKARNENRLLDLFLHYINPIHWLAGLYHTSIKPAKNVSALKYLEQKTDHGMDWSNLLFRFFGLLHIDIFFGRFVMWLSFTFGLMEQGFHPENKGVGSFEEWKKELKQKIISLPFFFTGFGLFTVLGLATLGIITAPYIIPIILTAIVVVYTVKTGVELLLELKKKITAKNDLPKVKDPHVENAIETLDHLKVKINKFMRLELIKLSDEQINTLSSLSLAVETYKGNAKKHKKLLDKSFTSEKVSLLLQEQKNLLDKIKNSLDLFQSIAQQRKIQTLAENTQTLFKKFYGTAFGLNHEAIKNIIMAHDKLREKSIEIGWNRIKLVYEIENLGLENFRHSLIDYLKNLSNKEIDHLESLLTVICDKNQKSDIKEVAFERIYTDIFSSIPKANHQLLLLKFRALMDYHNMQDDEKTALTIIQKNLNENKLVVLDKTLFSKNTLENQIQDIKQFHLLTFNEISVLEELANNIKINADPISILISKSLIKKAADNISQVETNKNNVTENHNKIRTILFNNLFDDASLLNQDELKVNELHIRVKNFEKKYNDLSEATNRWKNKPENLAYKGNLSNLLTCAEESLNTVKETQHQFNEKLKFGIFRAISLIGVVCLLAGSLGAVTLGAATFNPTLLGVGGAILFVSSIWIVGNIFLPRIINHMSSQFEKNRDNNLLIEEGRDVNSKLDKLLKKQKEPGKIHDLAENQAKRASIYKIFENKIRSYKKANKETLAILNATLYSAEIIKNNADKSNEDPETFAEKLNDEWYKYYKKIMQRESSLGYLAKKINLFAVPDQTSDILQSERMKFNETWKLALHK